MEDATKYKSVRTYKNGEFTITSATVFITEEKEKEIAENLRRLGIMCNRNKMNKAIQ